MDMRFIQRGLLLLVITGSLAGCGGGGGGSDDWIECSPSPSITPNPPTTATVGKNYIYDYEARFFCLLTVCDNAVPIQMPAGAKMDFVYDVISWVPTSDFANTRVRFSIKTEKDTCGNTAEKTWDVYVYPAPPTPAILEFSVDKDLINVGDSVILHPVFSNGSGYIQGIGEVSSGDFITVSSLDSSTTYTLEVANSYGDSVTSDISVQVLTPPTIDSFTTSKSIITLGDSDTLSWSISGDYSSVSIDPIGAIYNTQTIVVSPAENTMYTLSVSNEVGNLVTASLQIQVIPPPSITSFTATPDSSYFDDSVTMEPVFSDGVGKIYLFTESGYQLLSEAQSGVSISYGSLHRNTVFQLSVSNPLGVTVTRDITVPIYGPQTFHTITGSSRYRQRTVRLLDGKIFVAGGYERRTELFDQSTETFIDGPLLTEKRENFGMATMQDGRVLIAGGSEFWNGPILTTEIYDPFSNTTARTTDLPDYALNVRNALLLPDGRVLLYHQNCVSCSGNGEGVILFDPMTETYTPTVPMLALHLYPHIHLLDDGRVIFLEGKTPQQSEIYDPETDMYKLIGSMSTNRNGFASTKLKDGQIFIAGGGSNTAEIFDPTNDSFMMLDEPTYASAGSSAVTLNDGRVLLSGGFQSEIYDPTSSTFSATGGAVVPRSGHSTELLDDGRVWIYGGCSPDCIPEIYTN